MSLIGEGIEFTNSADGATIFFYFYSGDLLGEFDPSLSFFWGATGLAPLGLSGFISLMFRVGGFFFYTYGFSYIILV